MSRSSPLDTRIIRVFISSTFRDMQDERDELMKKTFPVLRRKAAERDVTLTELDLRWGITPEESESGKVVEICLREIENSVPFFVGIIGNRYGWIPSLGDLDRSLLERFSQVNGYVERQLSVTEMEMQFGVLERPDDMHAFFFIKKQETDDADEPEKLAALKAAVRNNGRYPVASYSSPEDLAGQVEAAFTKLLDELFPEGALSELEKERIGQRAYLNSLCQNYIRTDANFAVIDEWMQEWEKHQLVITGASGLGKSALVANWVKEKLNAGAELPYQIIYHFVGNGGSLGSHGHVIKALSDEIRNKYGFETNERESKTDEKALEELFNQVAADGDKPLLIVLDAINQIIDIDNSKQLNWLPIPPNKVKILFTTLEYDQTMDVFKNRHYPIYTLQPLTKAQRKEMVREYLGLYSKKLQPHQIERVVTDKQCENTLVLKTLLDELVNFGIFEKLDEKIGTYLGAASVEEFYGILLSGYEADFGEPFVKHILSLIAVSRNGLSEEELLAITKETPLHWSQFFCAIHQHLIVKNGLITFAHSYIRKAAENRYLQRREDWGNECRKEIVIFFNDAKTHRAMDELPYQYDKLGDMECLHGYLVDLEVFGYLKKKEENTLGGYWRKLICDKKYSLAEYLPLVERAKDSSKVEIYSGLSSFTRTTVVDAALSQTFIEKALPFVDSQEVRARVFTLLGLSWLLSGNYEKALEYEEEALKIRRFLFEKNHPSVAISYNNIGIIYHHLGKYKKALEYEEEALKIDISLYGESHLAVANLYANVGETYCALGDDKKGLEYKEKALKIRMDYLGENDPEVADTFSSVGLTYCSLGNYQLALEKHKRAIDIAISCLGKSHPDVGHHYSAIGLFYQDMGDYKKALKYQKKALDIAHSFFGEKHLNTASAYNNIGNTFYCMGQYKKAFEYQERALNIRLLFGENLPDTAISYRDIGLTVRDMGDFRKSLEYQERALRIRLLLFGESHPETAGSFGDVGECYVSLGDYRQALFLMKKAHNIKIGIFGENHPSIATSYQQIGVAYEQTGDHSKALQYDEKALKIRHVFFGSNHPLIAYTCFHIGFVYIQLKDYSKALVYLEKTLKIQLSYFGENHPDVATTYNNVGATYGNLGDHQKEIEYRNKALEIAIRIADDNLVATLYNRVGRAYASAGQKETANDYFRKAAQKFRELGNEMQAQLNMKEIEG